MKKKIGKFFHWLINGILIGGLLAFSVMFFKQGDTFHGVLDLLYMLIIVANLFYRQQYEKMKREHLTAMEASIELIKQNANLTKKNETLKKHLAQLNDPFSQDTIHVLQNNIRLEKIENTFKYEDSFLQGYDELERSRRKNYLEMQVKSNLLESIRDTELIEIQYKPSEMDNVHSCLTASMYVGVKGDKPIDEIINS